MRTRKIILFLQIFTCEWSVDKRKVLFCVVTCGVVDVWSFLAGVYLLSTLFSVVFKVSKRTGCVVLFISALCLAAFHQSGVVTVNVDVLSSTFSQLVKYALNNTFLAILALVIVIAIGAVTGTLIGSLIRAQLRFRGGRRLGVSY